MSAARDVILGRIRAALSNVQSVSLTVPRRDFRQAGTTDRAVLVAEFARRTRDYKVRVDIVVRTDAAAAIGGFLHDHGLRRLVLPDGFPTLLVPAGFDFLSGNGLDRDTIAGADGVLTICAGAIAETGTIILDHGPGQGPRILTLLPDFHLCLVDAWQIVALVPEAVAHMKSAVQEGRPVTFISGPSATSDIELSRVEGVHGPRTLGVVILVDDTTM